MAKVNKYLTQKAAAHEATPVTAAMSLEFNVFNVMP